MKTARSLAGLCVLGSAFALLGAEKASEKRDAPAAIARCSNCAQLTNGCYRRPKGKRITLNVKFHHGRAIIKSGLAAAVKG